MAHWWISRLPVQEAWTPSLTWGDPTCCGVTKPVLWSLGAAATEPTCPRACASQEKPGQWEACAPQLESSPLRATREKPVRHQRPSAAKNKVNKIKKKFSVVFFHRNGTLFKSCMDPPKAPITKAILRNKSKAKDIMLPDFKLYYKAVVIRTVWYWYKNGHTGQLNRVESPEINPQIFCQLTAKEQEYMMGKRWSLLDSHMKKNEIGSFLTPYSKIKWV